MKFGPNQNTDVSLKQMRFALILLATVLMAQVNTAQRPTGASKTRTASSAAPRSSSIKKPAVVPALTTDDEKTIYALGLSVYQLLGPFNLSAQEVEIVKQAISDAASGKPAEDLATWKPKIQNLAETRAAQALQQQKEISDAYLAKAAGMPGATKTASGLIYRELTPGTGPSPKPTDTVKVNYRGTLADGTEFDSSYKRNEPAEFALNGVIACWTEGLQQMKVGGKSMLVCPSSLAYGDQGRPGIPGGAALTFEIELLGITAQTP